MKKITSFSDYKINEKFSEISEEIQQGNVGGCSMFGGCPTVGWFFAGGFFDYNGW